MELSNSTNQLRPVFNNDLTIGFEADHCAPRTSDGRDKLAQPKSNDAPPPQPEKIKVPWQGEVFRGRLKKSRGPRKSRKSKSKKAKARVRRLARKVANRQNQKNPRVGLSPRSGDMGVETRATTSRDAGTKVVGKGTQTSATEGCRPTSKEVGAQTTRSVVRSTTRDTGNQTTATASVQLASGSPTMSTNASGEHKRRCRRQRRSVNVRGRAVFAASAASVLPADVDDDDDDNDHSASAAIPDVDTGEMISLPELFQWLKLQAIGNQKQPPVVCMRVGVDRLPQPQDYREVQRGRQHTLGSLERQLRGRSRANGAPSSGMEQASSTQQSPSTQEGGQRAAAGADGSSSKGKKGSASKTTACSPRTAFKARPSSRTSSSDGDAGSAHTHTGHSTASSPVVSAAQPTGSVQSAASSPVSPQDTVITASTSTNPDELPGPSSVPFQEDQRWLHDASCPLHGSNTPVIGFRAGRVPDRNLPDLRFRTTHPVAYVISNNKTTRCNEIRHAEKQRNAERKQATVKAKREDLTQLQRQMALQKMASGDAGAAGASAEAL